MDEPLLNPVKTYEIVNTGTFTDRNLVIQQNNQTLYYIKSNRSALFSSSPPFTIRTDSPTGTIVAAGKFPSFSHGIRIVLGDPNSMPWSELDSGMTSREYKLIAPDGHPYIWRRTHDSKLGASTFGSGSYKLLDMVNGEKLLAVYNEERKFFGSRANGQIAWFVDFEQSVELFLLTAILVIEAHLRAKRRRGGAAGGGAGAGA